jgi:ElaB/YqjD/DUF883 family membrane-anchored ribosome-binding protein
MRGVCTSLSQVWETLFQSNFIQENSMEATTRASTTYAAGDGSKDSIMNKAEAGMHGAVDRVVGAADVAAGKVQPAIDRAAQVAHQAVSKVADFAGPTANWLCDKGERLDATRRKVAADTSEYVSAHPWKSLAFALVAGLLISRFIR